MNYKSAVSVATIFLTSLFFIQPSYGQNYYFGGNTAFSDITLKSVSGKEQFPFLRTGTGYRLYAGRKFTKSLSMETFYANSEQSTQYKVGELDGAVGDLWDFLDNVIFFGSLSPGIYATVDTNVNYYGLNAKYSRHFNRKLSFFLKAGLSQWESKINISVPDQPTISDTDTGRGANYGAGLRLHFNTTVSMYFEYEKYNFSDIQIEMYGIGTAFQF